MATEQPGALRVRLLGVIEASRDGARIDLGPGRQRAVFVALALRANQVVSRDAVIDAVWGESPPAGAGNSLYSYISRLRRVLELDGAREVLISEGDGYSLRLDPGALDVHQFDHFRQVAQECWNRRDIHGTRAALDSALALWQGEALTGVDSPLATLHRKRLGELRLAALERRAEARIVSSDAGAVPELYRLAAAHPLRETLIGLLMTALCRDGRIAEAVEVFEQTRQLLVDQLGIEPGAALRRVYDEIVAGATAAPVRADVPHVGPRPPDVLVGRVSELATLRSRLTDVRRGRGGTVWVEGGPGSGKSGLLAAAFGDADRPEVGCKLLWAAGDEVGRRLPLGLMLTCLGINESSADHRAAELAQAMRGPTTELYPWRPTDPELVAVDRLANYVDQLTAAGPVVLVLDDLQWADDASLLVWHRLTKITRQSPLLLVGAIRSLPRRPETERLRAAVAAGHGNVVRLKALDAAAAGELTGRLLGAQPGPGLLNAIDCAAGNPLFLREVVEALVRDGVVKVSDGVAEVSDQLDDPCQPTVRSAVDKRLALLADTTREALRWAAVLGSEFDLGDLATVMACSVSELIPAVEEASANGVLVEAGQWYAFRHSMLRRAVYVSMPVNVRVALHRQAAEMLHAAGAHVERVAEQLLAASVEADAWVTNWLVDNVNAIAGRSPAIAVELLSRAVAGHSRGHAREVLMVRLVRLQFWLGKQPEAEARTVLAMTRDRNRAAEMRLMLAYFDYDRENNERALQQVRRVASDPSVPSEWRARHRSLQALIEREAFDDLDAAVKSACGALVLGSQTGDKFAVSSASQVLWQVSSLRRNHVEALGHIDSAIDMISGQPALADLQLSLLGNKVLTLQNLDRLGEADRTLAQSRRLAGELGLPGGPYLAAAVQYYWLGRWDEALAELDSVVHDGPEITFYGVRQRGLIRLLHGIAARIAAHRDDSAAMETALKAAAACTDPTVQARENGDFLLMASAVAAEQSGDPARALALLAPVLDSKYAPMMLRHQWLPTIVRLALEVGDDTIATAALELSSAEADKEYRPARAHAALHWCRGLASSDAEEILLVVKHFSNVGRRVEYAMAAEDAAVLLARRGEIPAATRAARDAMAVYSELRAAWDASRASSRLRPFGIEFPPARPAET